MSNFGSHDFLRSERGVIAVIWAMALVMFLAFLAVIVDTGRLNSTHSELQAYADAVAIAAAAELDGGSDAITRATNAAALVPDTQTFADGDRNLAGAASYTLTFLSDLPANDTAPITNTYITTDPRQARLAWVRVTPRSLAMDFSAGVQRLLGWAAGTELQSIDVTAEAVAGFTTAACDITPLMFCLPPGFDKANPTATLPIGIQILLRSGGNGAAWGPGDFGFIDLDEFQDESGVCADEGGNKLACLLAAQEGIAKCAFTRGITTEPGQKVGITNAAFNVRFDIYRATLNGERNNPDFRPAPNVIKGIKAKGGGKKCIQGSEVPTDDTMALPRDSDVSNDNRFGNGIWNRVAYGTMNHDAADANGDGTVSEEELDAFLPEIPGKYLPEKTAAAFKDTRYGLYIREIAKGDAAPDNEILTATHDERGRPQCSTAGYYDNPARRVVVAAGIDCIKNPVSGKTTNVPVEIFVQVFLTEPVGDDGGSPPSFDLHGEVIGFADRPGFEAPGASGLFRDVVQLYR